MLVLGVTVLALCVAFVIPLRWGVFGYLSAAVLLFLGQVGVNVSMGFGGTSLEDSLLLFNGSYLSYLWFNVQISYRGFALPLLALGGGLVFRLSPGRSFRGDRSDL